MGFNPGPGWVSKAYYLFPISFYLFNVVIKKILVLVIPLTWFSGKWVFGYISFMNCFHMRFNKSLWWKDVFTNITLFLIPCNMPYWTLSENLRTQYLQLNTFSVSFFMWYLISWVSKLILFLHFFLHIVHSVSTTFRLSPFGMALSSVEEIFVSLVVFLV